MNLRLHLLGPLLLTLGALVWLAHAVVEEAPVRVLVEGARVQFEPATVRLRVRVTPHAENRLLTVAAVADGFVVRRSDEDLDGAAAPLARWIEWRDVPAGEYAVIARLSRASGSLDDRTSLSVIGRGF